MILLYTDIDDLFDVKMTLKNLNDWQSLGLALGLLYPTLKKIDDDQRGKKDKCVMEMIAAWLQQQDNVSRKGVPSWSVLRAALRKIGENEITDTIRGEFVYNKNCSGSDSTLLGSYFSQACYMYISKYCNTYRIAGYFRLSNISYAKF